MYLTGVLISLFEKQKLTSINIRMASFLIVVAPCGFFLFVCMYVSRVGTDKISAS
jgi:hypothetical protein